VPQPRKNPPLPAALPPIQGTEYGNGNDRKSKGNWITGATKNKGGLHRSLGIPEGQPIPSKKLTKAASKGGKVGKQARLAQTLKGFKK
jgi:hypothetical protein